MHSCAAGRVQNVKSSKSGPPRTGPDRNGLPTDDILLLSNAEVFRVPGGAAWVGLGCFERAADVGAGSPVDTDSAATSRSAAASMAFDFCSRAAGARFWALRAKMRHTAASRCAMPRARMHRGST